MSQPRQRGQQHPWSRRLWIGYWFALFAVMHTPVAGGPPTAIPHVDKLLHFGLYFLLTWLGGRHVLAMAPRSPMATLIVWAVVYAAYAAADESLQPFFGRTMSFVDWLGDLAGIAASTVVLALKHRGRPASKPPNSPL